MVAPVTLGLENDSVLQANICFHFWHSRVIVVNAQRFILAYPAKRQGSALFSSHRMGAAVLRVAPAGGPCLGRWGSLVWEWLWSGADLGWAGELYLGPFKVFAVHAEYHRNKVSVFSVTAHHKPKFLYLGRYKRYTEASLLFTEVEATVL